jgi:HD-GYP domain-containing protein (c-di-GMP phosphodiesterase class II)
MKLPVSHILPGMRLSKPVYGLKGQMLLNRGVELTLSYINGLKRNNVLAVMVESVPGFDTGGAEKALEESVRVRAMSNIQNWAATGRKRRQFSEVADSVSEIVDEILAGKIPSGGLAEISTTDVYTFAHSIDVCAFAVYMGLNYGLKKSELLTLGTGSILHDLGKTQIPHEILNKPGRLTEEEIEEIKQHPVYGYNMLQEQESGQLSESSLRIVLDHHERYNGSGYPRGISGDEISDMVSICALSDVFSAMTTERVYRKAFPPNEAYELLMTYGDLNFKLQHIKLFSSCVCPYPLDTLVLLSTGEVACVTALNRNLPFRPVVTLLEAVRNIDLSKELSVVIKKVLKPEEAQSVIIRHALVWERPGMGRGNS